MFQADKLIRTIHSLEHGEARLGVMSTAIAEADAASAHSWRIYFRYEYIRESIFYGDRYKAIICFPELLQVFDEHPELQADTCDDVMQAFKWVLENMQDFYQISREEIEQYFAEFEKRSRKYGNSLRVYYMKKCKFYLAVDQAIAREAYEQFHAARRGTNSDCAACEANFDMEVALTFGDEQAALRIAAPILSGELRCGEIPHATYAELANYYLHQGNYAEALYYGALCERLICDEPEFLQQTGYLLALYSAADPSRGWRIFKNTVDSFTACRNPLMRMYYAAGAWRLMETIGAQTPYTDSKLLRQLPVTWTQEGAAFTDLAAYFRSTAQEQAERLDARNGTDFYCGRLFAPLPAYDEAKAFEPQEDRPVRGLVRRTPVVLAAVLPEGEEPSPETLTARFEAAVPAGLELLSCGVDEQGMYLSVRSGGALHEVLIVPQKIAQPLPVRPAEGLSEEELAAMMAVPQKYLIRAELGDDAVGSFRVLMQVTAAVFPELLGLLSLLTQKAYPAAWVRFAAAYPHAVSVYDLFGLYLCAADEAGEKIWMTTLGMSCLGMRELQLEGADRENYAAYADMLQYAAAQCITRGIMPDAGRDIARFFYGEEPFLLTWQPLPADEEEPPCAALLLHEEDALCPPPAYEKFTDVQQLEFPNIRTEFRRRIALAKETCDLFAQACAGAWDRAAARLEFELDEDAAEEFGYGIELLWGDVVPDADTLQIRLGETSEALPELEEGTVLPVTAETITGWMIRPQDGRRTVTEETAYLLGEVQS